MGDLFYWLFNMSIAGALTGLIILLIRAIKKLPRRLIAILWAIPFFRFWFPVGVGGKYSLMSLLSRFAARTVVVYEGELMDFSMMNSVKAADNYFPITYRTSLLSDVFRYAALVWAIVAAGLILAMTPIGKIAGSTELSNIMLYMVIGLIASRASFMELLEGGMAWWIVAGFVILGIHGVLMVIFAKLFKLDMFTCCVASLANIGGTASAPILAASYSGSLVSVGVLMALMGYVVGTFGGIGVGYLMSIFG